MKNGGIKKVRTAFGVSEYSLSNGLRVLFKRVTSAPVVAVCMTFHVGSRNEAKGHTGATHLLEHMLFKDTENFNTANGKPIKNYLEWFGAAWNGTTWLDRTNYFELLPREHLDKSLAVQADRMRRAAFTAQDLKSEMTVVRNEFERSRNNPFELLDEEMIAKAFTRHPYRIPTIGTKEDIENATVEKLYEFYNTFYWPNNATLAVIGDVSFEKTTKLVLNYFSGLPHSPHSMPRLKVVEPAQQRERSVSLKRHMGANIAALMYKVPEGRHKDSPALYAAAMVLGAGFSARLGRSLVDTGLAASVSVSAHAYHDPGLMSFWAHVADGVRPALVLKRMRKEIARFAKEGPTKHELALARERILSQKAADHDGVLKQVQTLSEAVAAGDWTVSYAVEKKIHSLTAAAVRGAAKKYFIRAGETSGTLVHKK